MSLLVLSEVFTMTPFKLRSSCLFSLLTETLLSVHVVLIFLILQFFHFPLFAICLPVDFYTETT